MIEQPENTEPLTRREREKAQHRQEIMEAAIIVFSEKGFFAATLEEIAQKAEFSKGALYLYFQNKEDLLFIILKESMEGWIQTLETIITQDRPFREGLKTLFTGAAEKIFDTPHLFALLSAQHATLFQALSKDNREELCRLRNRFWNVVQRRVVTAIEEGEIRDFAPEAVIGLIRGSLDVMAQNRWDCETLEDLMKAIDIYIDMVFNGIASRKE